MTATTYRPRPLPAALPAPRPVSLEERRAAIYAHHRLHLFPDDRAAVADALDLPGARHLAEIGCGPGFYALSFAARYPHLQVTGIDRAPAQLAIARARVTQQGCRNVRIAAGDACALAPWRGAFDRVIASRLLMVVPERERSVAEMRRTLAPGGMLLLAEPLAPPVRLLAALRSAVPDGVSGPPPAPPHLFTAASFASLVEGEPWAAVRLWEAHGYRYARCRTAS